MIAIVRPHDWDFPLLVHVLGAMVMVGSLVLAAAALMLAWRGGGAAQVRLGYRALLLGVIPGWVVMRAGAEWIAHKEHLQNSNVTWIGIGFTTSDIGFVVMIVATVLAGLAVRRLRREGGRSGAGRPAAVLVSVLLAAYVVTIWAMTTKPT